MVSGWEDCGISSVLLVLIVFELSWLICFSRVGVIWCVFEMDRMELLCLIVYWFYLICFFGGSLINVFFICCVLFIGISKWWGFLGFVVYLLKFGLRWYSFLMLMLVILVVNVKFSCVLILIFLKKGWYV